MENTRPIRIFVSYSRKDSRWLQSDSLVPSLERSLRRHHVEFWYDKQGIHAGDDFSQRIQEEIDGCDAALLLVSPEFLNSDFIQTIELPRIQARAEAGEMVVIPILLEPCDWTELEFLNSRQIIPGDPTPLIDYVGNERQWSHVRNEILEKIKARLQRAESAKGQATISFQTPFQLDSPSSLQGQKVSPSRKQISCGLVIALGLMLVFGALTAAFYLSRRSPTQPALPVPAPIDTQYALNRDNFLGALPHLRWILYEPSDYDPLKNQDASEASIRKDLEVLRQNGFDGLITMTSRGSCKHIPRIAHEQGFLMVIAGVWEIRDKNEVDNALESAKYADAYCLGHDGLGTRYVLAELEEFMKGFKQDTRRPATTSALVVDYETDPKLAQLGDFLFPDAHSSWLQGQTPEAAWKETLDLDLRMGRIAAQTGKLVLLKMISYPSGGGHGFSEDRQAEFYRLVNAARDRTDIPAGITFSFLGAFDPEWKTPDAEFQKPEQFTGLFTRNRAPKLAITGIKWSRRR